MAYYACLACDDWFLTRDALNRHIRRRHHATYCIRCSRTFNYPDDKERHLRDSPQHHICELCPQKADWTSHDLLSVHMNQWHYPCDVCNLVFSTEEARDKHENEVHFRCHRCRRYFHSYSNFSNHMKTHAPRKVSCPGCPKSFISYSALVLHFEANTCWDNLNARWVDKMAQFCSERYWGYHWRADTYSDYPWKCPTCDKEVKIMSALLQHVESDACGEKLWNGALAEVVSCFQRGRYPDDSSEDSSEDSSDGNGTESTEW